MELVKLTKGEDTKMVSNPENIEILKAAGWFVEGDEADNDTPKRGRKPKVVIETEDE